MRKTLFIFSLLAIIVLASCSQEVVEDVSLQDVQEVRVIAPDDIIFEDVSTRGTEIAPSGALRFSWAIGDTLGIFPNQGNQVEFPITATDGSTSAVFDGGGWGLKSNASYAAYYPFNVWNYHRDNKTIIVDYAGQVQNGNGSFSHLSAYDYLASSRVTATDNRVTFQMDRLGAILYIDIVVSSPCKVNSLEVFCDEAIFTERAALDISGDDATIVPIKNTNTLTLNFKNVETTTAGETVRAYMAVSPVDLTNKSVNATVYTDNGRLSAPVVSREVNKGKAAILKFSEDFSPVIAVESLSLSQEELNLLEGNDAKLQVAVYPDNAWEKSVTWTSANESVATVDSEGNIHAVAPGATTVTVCSKDGYKTATCNVKVSKYYPVTALSIEPAAVNVLIGKTISLNTVYSPSNASEKAVDWSSSDEEVCSVSPKGVITGHKVGTSVVTVTSLDARAVTVCSAQCTVTVTAVPLPDAIDMGLSSVRWASFNLGASAPEGVGNYYAWGEPETKSSFSFSNYKWGDGIGTNGYQRYTKYVNNLDYGGVIDNLTMLESEDDAAHVALGGKWRMPTYDEWLALLRNCSFTEVTVNGVSGVQFKSKVSPYNKIFFPYTGYKENSSKVGTGFGYYWISEGGGKNMTNYGYSARLLYDSLENNTNLISNLATHLRYHGLIIRAVYAE